MKLTNAEKRIIENDMVMRINRNPNGINTRTLISQVLNNVALSIPNANRHHVSGMLSWVFSSYNFSFLTRTPGYSIIA
ncbi:MAG: hypothetical protein ACRCZK_05035 [Oscillospiraceae bacterium]